MAGLATSLRHPPPIPCRVSSSSTSRQVSLHPGCVTCAACGSHPSPVADGTCRDRKHDGAAAPLRPRNRLLQAAPLIAYPPQVRYRITSHFGESTAGGADHARSRRSRPGARSVLRERDATGKIAARRREPWQAPERRRSGALGRAGCPGVHPGTHAWPTGWGARSDLDVRLHAEVPAGDRGESPSVRQGRRRSRAAVATARIAQRLRDHPR
jgi:hypothetical protein